MDQQLFYVGVFYLKVNYTKDNSNAISVHDYRRPLGFQKANTPRFFFKKRTERGTPVSPTHRPCLSPRKYSW